MRRLLAAGALGLAVFALAPAAQAAVPWCGTPETADRVPDLVSAFHWHVVYAFPSDRPDRFGAVAPLIAGDAFEMSSWWRNQDPTRVPRFDLHEFPNCPSEFGRLDISRVSLAATSSTYTDFMQLVQGVVRQVERPPFASSADKAYLIYYQGPSDKFCGVGGLLGRDSDTLGFAIVYLEACDLEAKDGLRSAVATHEMLHGLGAVPRVAGPGPPNACPGDPVHVCDHPGDLMAASHSAGATLASLALDVGRNDYYGHGGPWWDIRSNSLFLNRLDAPDRAPPTAPLRPTATSVGTRALFTWDAARDDIGPVWYRVYNERGSFRAVLQSTSFSLASVESVLGAVLVFHVRAVDAVGFLSQPVTIRFRVGYGLVDEEGRLVRDTVPPGPVTRLRLRLRSGAVVASWRRAADLGGLRGYRVRIGNRPHRLVRTTSVSIPLARAAGRLISVAAVDRGGNRGEAAVARAPRNR